MNFLRATQPTQKQKKTRGPAVDTRPKLGIPRSVVRKIAKRKNTRRA